MHSHQQSEGAREFPLSFAQQRLWFIDKLEPGNVAYNLPFGLWLRGKINPAALQYSLNQLVKRHGVLRTSFPSPNGEPIQKVADPADVNLAIERFDLRTVACDPRQAEAIRLMQEEAERPFNLEQAPLLRMKLVQLEEERHLLLGNMHHIISDGWSIGLLLREISQQYAGYMRGEEIILPELKVQYAEFATWQREWLRRLPPQQMEYWRRQLKGVAVLPLPTDKPRASVRSQKGATIQFKFSDHLTTKLRQFCRQEKATLFMALLAAFQVLLSRYAGEQEVAVGTAIANRTRKEFRDVVGLFANTLVLRTNVAGNPGFREVLARVREVAFGAYKNQDVPFDQLVSEIEFERDLSRTPLFQVMMLLQNVDHAKTLDLPGLHLEEFTPVVPAAKFDLTLEFIESPDAIRGDLSFASELFEPQTARRMVDQLQSLLEQVAANPERRISEILLLADFERQQFLVDWNATEVEYPQVFVHENFERQVTQAPNSVAVEHDGQRLTYAELNRRANQLARYLKKLGIGPETLVGISLERGFDMVVGLMAILKAGGAYVPLDPSYPRERLRYMVDDSRPAVLLTQESLENQWEFYQGRIVKADKDWSSIQNEDDENLKIAGCLSNLCYVIYTSGSTGTPKGVQISHKALSNFLFSMRKKPGISKEDVLLAETPLSFDIAGLEIYLPLVTGACLRILGRAAGANGVRLSNELENGVTMVQATPASWQIALEAGWKGTEGLKVLCGGEALSLDLAKKLVSRSSVVWNMYGPTETTIWSLIEELKEVGDGIALGRPIANTSVYVLDDYLEPVPAGVRGELYIGGDGLARGYRGRPELTAARFIPNPFTNRQGDRLYRTGDIVRWRNDGTLEFLGRADHQVKVSGHRIELGEIENALAQCDGLLQSVVIAYQESSGEKRLIAYLAANHKEDISIDGIRASLKSKLPAYMIPSEFVVMDSLPLSPNGKLNRRALPQPGAFRQRTANQFADPTTRLEKKITTIWQEVLHRDRVSVDDNFFDIGGDSLRSVRVHNQLTQSLNLQIDLVELFKFPTIRSLARHLESDSKQTQDSTRSATGILNAGKERLKRQLVYRESLRHKVKIS
ncbi:MAG TPA: amino acid adenylation domain-containing protein [Candidatus Angelobacter sp.]|nr:amino acid adenylation domain-containing protein [Candidatus Angelobacter sp.]